MKRRQFLGAVAALAALLPSGIAEAVPPPETPDTAAVTLKDLDSMFESFWGQPPLLVLGPGDDIKQVEIVSDGEAWYELGGRRMVSPGEIWMAGRRYRLHTK